MHSTAFAHTFPQFSHIFTFQPAGQSVYAVDSSIFPLKKPKQSVATAKTIQIKNVTKAIVFAEIENLWNRVPPQLWQQSTAGDTTHL